MRTKLLCWGRQLLALTTATMASSVWAGEANLKLPDLAINLDFFGIPTTGTQILVSGLFVCALGMVFGVYEFLKIKGLPAHKSMRDISELIYETCKTYMIQQGKFLVVLQLLIGAAMVYYFYFLRDFDVGRVALILLWSVLGILGSFAVAWFGIRINNYANSRTAFASLRGGNGWDVMSIPLRAGMSIGVLLICVELILMLIILLLVPPELAGPCFIGFAIGESLGASALRVAGGIFTKIADIGSDLMKIVFNIKEDDARNPGVIADCTGDNAGDSVGPTADGFETYGVTGVALISFIMLAVGMMMTESGLVLKEGGEALQAKMIIWIFAMRILMVITSVFSYWINDAVTKSMFASRPKFNFELPLTSLVWLTSIISIVVTFVVSDALLGFLDGGLWWKLSIIISCGTLAGALIPEFTKVFTSAHSRHVAEIVNASREGGASLTILSGLVAGNFSAFWKGMIIAGLMFICFYTSTLGLDQYMVYPAVFAFGLLAFGFLGMGPVTIAVDSYGPVTDNAQSVFELSQIETTVKPDAIQSEFGFKPDFARGKHLLEENDSAGNTFKATAKPVLVGTAVIGATTMIFSIILLLNLKLDLLDPRVILGMITGGAVIYWFTGASMQAVTTGAYRAVEYIKKNIRLDSMERASVEKSKEVVKICTQYAQNGMFNIFGVLFSFTLAFGTMLRSTWKST
jgi:K(+)-stimulated pyrophosphate-energized sodium pump